MLSCMWQQFCLADAPMQLRLEATPLSDIRQDKSFTWSEKRDTCCLICCGNFPEDAFVDNESGGCYWWTEARTAPEKGSDARLSLYFHLKL